mgnify:CR=1 FL=1
MGTVALNQFRAHVPAVDIFGQPFMFNLAPILKVATSPSNDIRKRLDEAGVADSDKHAAKAATLIETGVYPANKRLVAALKDKGVDVLLQTLPGSGHGGPAFGKPQEQRQCRRT